MKTNYTSLMCCPDCQNQLHLEVITKNDDQVIEGLLICRQCQCFFPIISSIPRMLGQSQLFELVTEYPDFLRRNKDKIAEYSTAAIEGFSTDKRIATGFNFEWSHHSEILPEHEKELRHVFGEVLELDSFKNKTVLDAGCGQGRFSFFVKQFGAKLVVSMDLGEQVLLARKNLTGIDNIFIVQASIFKPPFRQIFDRVISIGVIHHLPDPELGFHTLYGKLKPGGDIFIWVYGHSSIIPIIKFLRNLTRGHSDRFNRIVALPFAVLLYGLTRVYKLLKAIGLDSIASLIPWNMYHERCFSNIWTITFDKLNSYIAVYYRREDLQEWVDRLWDMEKAILSERYPKQSGSSWRLFVKKKR